MPIGRHWINLTIFVALTTMLQKGGGASRSSSANIITTPRRVRKMCTHTLRRFQHQQKSCIIQSASTTWVLQPTSKRKRLWVYRLRHINSYQIVQVVVNSRKTTNNPQTLLSVVIIHWKHSFNPSDSRNVTMTDNTSWTRHCYLLGRAQNK